MTDIRERLNERREELLQNFDKDAMWVRDGADPSSPRYERSRRNIVELREIEATLATMQLADAQVGVADAQREVAAAQRDANLTAERERSASEDVTFWSRRYLTTISVGNAAGLSAVLIAMNQADAPAVDLRGLVWIILAFGGGAFLGGTVPLLRVALAVERLKPMRAFLALLAGWIYPILATACFLFGATSLIDMSLSSYSARELVKPEAVGATNE